MFIVALAATCSGAPGDSTASGGAAGNSSAGNSTMGTSPTPSRNLRPGTRSGNAATMPRNNPGGTLTMPNQVQGNQMQGNMRNPNNRNMPPNANQNAIQQHRSGGSPNWNQNSMQNQNRQKILNNQENGNPVNVPPPTVNNPPPRVNSPPPKVNSRPPNANSRPPAANSPPPAANSTPPVLS